MSRTRQPVNLQPQSTTETSSESSTLRLTGTLRLRAEDTSDTTAEPSPARRIRWSEDVVDNEGMGKKSSKVCCIYHKARPVGESSSESESSSSSSESDSESEADNRSHMAHHARHSHARGRRPSGDNQADQSPDGDSATCCSDHHQKVKRRRRKPSPNAYEKMPKPSKNPQPRGT
ncbi:hypothetical protein PMG11_07699 [Penicillium brasilianum]|uniref:Type 1 phosphatases regulator n=1 Tax=Penicillium brasilianum TaxID=104259 RepID=A0A0F7TQM0_PENBI|nr:hypothetical protein PMG11_07699 [Penicillium brasilianum]